MIKKELAKDPNLATEDWSRFLPKFKKKTMSKRKKPLVVSEKRSYTPFPPAPVPSKIDLQIESGEYFLNEAQRKLKNKVDKQEVSKIKSQEKKVARLAEFIPPAEKDYYNDDNEDNDETKKRKKKKRSKHDDDDDDNNNDNTNDNDDSSSSRKSKKSKK